MTQLLTIPTVRRTHPLDALTADEISAVRDHLVDEGRIGDRVRFAYVGLHDPAKRELRAWAAEPSAVPHRRARVILLDTSTGATTDLVVDLTAGATVAATDVDPALVGQAPVLLEEFAAIEEILAADDGWRAALATRGLTPDDVRVAPLSAGIFDYAGEEGRRLLRGLAFVQRDPSDYAWGHPVDQLVAFVDMIDRRVVRIIDDGPADIPLTNGNFEDPELTGPLRTDLKPIAITQPEGPSFTLDGNVLRWWKWDLHVGFDAREGLVLSRIGFDDRGTRRSIVDRASIAEMVVPYGDPAPYRSWQNYFDTGEYLVGRDANSLELGCDCLGEITYLSPVVADDFGNPREIPQAICIHEEDVGLLWKHTDEWANHRSTRRQRRLVVSFFTTVGNYDYGFYWYLYLDGTIEFEAKATGIVFTARHPERDYPYASQIAPGLAAPYHQHLFCARLDMAVDGERNAVHELDLQRVPMGEGNPHGNAFTRSRRVLGTESQARRKADGSVGRVWEIVNTDKTNIVGEHVAYTLFPEGQPTLAMAEDSSIARRAAFATEHLWVTRFAQDERYPAGDFVNQSIGSAGLPEYTAADRDIDGQDIVLWHSFGLTHFPRTEDWPIMPVDHTGFTLKPTGFFDQNPALDLPPSPATKAHCAEGACHC
ncbi:primary-amine oxidase [Microbacterium rhizosphaerae]|uniref:Amine oxidase n=1 Tax=Microbacterium rhizosphaerae TaxID=1678237 RepID=A0ABZ0SLJ6_9MICO|nr:primary-amine oxidase [Microbacterium rhizosphaerae]WPR89060.1 primary-amine oxidase [Microbacterium rhizosphaerae]